MTPELDRLEVFSGKPDALVLEQFVRVQNDAAFCELVRRHSTMVHASALRICGDRTMAEEVAQSTLLILAKKARGIKIPEYGTLGPWLHRVAVLEARNASKKEQRRRRNMQKLSEEIRDASSDHQPPDDAKWKAALPHLDGAIDALSERDRRLIVMRFMEEQPFREIGFAFGGLSEDAVRMRTKRAVKKLSKLLSRRGAAVPAALLATGLAALSTPKLSAATATQQSCAVLALVSSSSAPATLSFASVLGLGWGARIVAFVLGLGIPVAYSGFDRDSRAVRGEVDYSKRSSSEWKGIRNPHPPKSNSKRTPKMSPLERLLAQITQLENEFEYPMMLSEALEAIMELEADQLPLVWETARAEQPPRVITDTIIIRWTELDPEGALAVCGEIGDGMKQGSLAINVWYQSDPDGAVEYFRSRPPEYFEVGKKHFWQTFAFNDPGLGLQVSLELGSGEVLQQMYRYTLVQGWFRSQGLDFMTDHLEKRPATFLPFNHQIVEKIDAMPALNAEQLTGALMWTVGIGTVEDRTACVEALMSKLEPTSADELRDWIRDSPLLQDDLRDSLLEHPNLISR